MDSIKLDLFAWALLFTGLYWWPMWRRFMKRSQKAKEPAAQAGTRLYRTRAYLLHSHGPGPWSEPGLYPDAKAAAEQRFEANRKEREHSHGWKSCEMVEVEVVATGERLKFP